MLKNKGITLIIIALLFFTQDMLAQNSSKDTNTPKTLKTVKGLMQAKPGGPLEEVEVTVHEVPVNLPSFMADNVKLPDDELVLGIVVENIPMAYPIRFLAMYEIVDDQVGETAIAPTW